MAGRLIDCRFTFLAARRGGKSGGARGSDNLLQPSENSVVICLHSSGLKQRAAENFVPLNIARQESQEGRGDAMIEARIPSEFAELREIKSRRACYDLFNRPRKSPANIIIRMK